MAKTKTLTEILKRLGVNVQAARKPVQATRPALKAQPKISRTTGRKTKPDVKISTPTAGKGRKGVQATTPSIKAARPVLKAKPKISRTTGRKKSTAVVPAGSTAVTKQPSTALVPSGSRAVAGKPTPKPSRPMKRVYDNKPKALTGPKAATNNRLRNTILATIAATGAGTALMQDKDKAASAGTPSVRPKSKPASPGTPKVLPKSKPAKPSTAKTTEGGPGRMKTFIPTWW